MNLPLSRRRFLRQTAAASALAPLALPSLRSAVRAAEPPPPGSPIDFHVHLDNSTLEKALALPQAHTVRFGIVEHAGTKENQYPRVLSNDQELEAYLAMLAGQPVFRGVQAEWTDWMGCFSRPALARLDYVLTDAMTFPAPDGHRVKLWEPDALQRVALPDPEKFMDRYVDWHVEVMAKEPFDILANTSWLPAPLDKEWDRYWTAPRVQKVVAAALKYGVALEISASYELPKLSFLQPAKAAGVKFSFGSNGRYPKMGKLEYCLAMAKELNLQPADMFAPAPDGQKAVQRRNW